MNEEKLRTVVMGLNDRVRLLLEAASTHVFIQVPKSWVSLSSAVRCQ